MICNLGSISFHNFGSTIAQLPKGGRRFWGSNFWLAPSSRALFWLVVVQFKTTFIAREFIRVKSYLSKSKMTKTHADLVPKSTECYRDVNLILFMLTSKTRLVGLKTPLTCASSRTSLPSSHAPSVWVELRLRSPMFYFYVCINTIMCVFCILFQVVQMLLNIHNFI